MTMPFELQMAFWDCALSGEILEYNAMMAEKSERAVWDGTDAERRTEFVINQETRKIKHPPYWTRLPVVTYLIAEGVWEYPEY